MVLKCDGLGFVKKFHAKIRVTQSKINEVKDPQRQIKEIGKGTFALDLICVIFVFFQKRGLTETGSARTLCIT